MHALIALGQLGLPIIYFIVFGDVSAGLIRRINTSKIEFFESIWFTQSILGWLMLYLVLMKRIQGLKYADLFNLIFLNSFRNWTILIRKNQHLYHACINSTWSAWSSLLLSLLFVFIILFSCYYFIAEPNPSNKIDYEETTISIKIITSWSLVTTFFGSFGSLKHQSTKSGLTSSAIGLILMGIIFISSPILVFGMYGKSIKSNLLLNIANENGVIPFILLIIFLFVAIVHVPIIFFNDKEALMIIIAEACYVTFSKLTNTIKQKEVVGIDIHNDNNIHKSHSHHIDQHETHHDINIEHHNFHLDIESHNSRTKDASNLSGAINSKIVSIDEQNNKKDKKIYWKSKQERSFTSTRLLESNKMVCVLPSYSRSLFDWDLALNYCWRC